MLNFLYTYLNNAPLCTDVSMPTELRGIASVGLVEGTSLGYWSSLASRVGCPSHHRCSVESGPWKIRQWTQLPNFGYQFTALITPALTHPVIMALLNPAPTPLLLATYRNSCSSDWRSSAQSTGQFHLLGAHKQFTQKKRCARWDVSSLPCHLFSIILNGIRRCFYIYCIGSNKRTILMIRPLPPPSPAFFSTCFQIDSEAEKNTPNIWIQIWTIKQ